MAWIRNTVGLWGLLLVVALVGCAGNRGMSMEQVEAQTKGKKIAVVSLSVNDFGGRLQGWNKQNTGDLLSERMNEMLATTQQRFAGRWTVVEADQFIGKPDYRAAAGPSREVATPKLDGHTLALLGADRKQLVKAQADADKVSAVAKAAGADLVVVIYSEWDVKTGNMVPTSKPLTKTVVSIYDQAGALLFHGRKDVMGERTLGAHGLTVVDDETIRDWMKAYDKGLAALLGG